MIWPLQGKVVELDGSDNESEGLLPQQEAIKL